jgi:hypothetical protein
MPTTIPTTTVSLMTTSSLLTTIFSTIFGVVVSTVATVLLAYRKLNKLPNIRGEWHSEYQAADTPGNPWVYELIKIYTKWGKLRFITSENPKNDSIEGEVDVHGRDYVIGRWRQCDPNASNYGTLLLNLTPSGRLLFGVWSGTADTGERRIGGWVAARNRQDIVQGKAMLSTLMAKLDAQTSAGRA